MTEPLNGTPRQFVEDSFDPYAAEDPMAGLVAEEPALYYGSVDEFVREYLRHMYKRRIDGRNRVWSARWWAYGEAIARLEALWRSWEALRQDPATGMSVWWRDHADYHMQVLLDPDGVFSDSADNPENMNRKGQPLPYIQPPDGLFPDVRG